MNNAKKDFRGWIIPGPLPPTQAGTSPQVAPGETLDSISGHWRLFQLENGHRFSTDDVLTAWYGTTWAPRAERVLELGSGIGTVGLIAAWRLPAASFVTVEAQEQSVSLARKSITWNGVSERFELRQGDFRAPEVIREAELFDLVLGSPPYFPPGSGVQGDHPQKIACRFEMRGNISDYCAVASRHLAPGGLFACVFPVNPDEQHERVKRAAGEAGLVIVRWRPVVLRAPEQPLLGLFAMMRGQDLPEWMRKHTWEEPSLVIRQTDGSIHPEYSAVKLSFGFPP